MARDTHASTLQGWKRLIDSIAGKETEPNLKENREALLAKYQQALELAARRDAHQAAMQEASRALRETLDSGRRIKTLMRLLVKKQFGPDSELLVAFGIRPRRLIRKKMVKEITPAE